MTTSSNLFLQELIGGVQVPVDQILAFHIFAGVIALGCALTSVFAGKGKKLHIISGRLYFVGMIFIFLTALPLAFFNENEFLVFVSFLSFYFAFAGFRFARNRTGVPSKLDIIASVLLIFIGLSLWVLAALYFSKNNPNYIIPIVFGTVGISLGYQDLTTHLNRRATGKVRIEKHLSNMLAGTIAVLTAVSAVNINIQPIWIWWLLPTIFIAPLIAWWSRKVRDKGFK